MEHFVPPDSGIAAIGLGGPIGPDLAELRSVVCLALPLFGDDLSPRFCFARVAAVVNWDGTSATLVGKVTLGRSPYPARLELLADRSVRCLLCGSFPREHLADAARRGITVRCGLSGRVPNDNEKLTAFIAGLNLRLDDFVIEPRPIEDSKPHPRAI